MNDGDLRALPVDCLPGLEHAHGHAVLGGQDVKIHEEIGLVLPAGTPELSNRKIFQDDKESQSMVRMRVGQNDGIERRHAPVEELRKQARSSEVPPVEIEGASAEIGR